MQERCFHHVVYLGLIVKSNKIKLIMSLDLYFDKKEHKIAIQYKLGKLL